MDLNPTDFYILYPKRISNEGFPTHFTDIEGPKYPIQWYDVAILYIPNLLISFINEFTNDMQSIGGHGVGKKEYYNENRRETTVIAIR